MVTWFKNVFRQFFGNFQKMSRKCQQFSYGTSGEIILGLLVPLRRYIIYKYKHIHKYKETYIYIYTYINADIQIFGLEKSVNGTEFVSVWVSARYSVTNTE